MTVRRHYSFPADTDALQYGRGICDKVIQGETYAQVMDGAKRDVTPNDEFATDYLVSRPETVSQDWATIVYYNYHMMLHMGI